ncbi:MAG: DNA-deoxyinosine glycosylase [Novosphingobium sp.]
MPNCGAARPHWPIALDDIRKSSFAPVVAPRTRVLILGSLPGEASLAARRYYAHPQNQFWVLAGGVIGREIASLAYDERLAALTAGGIGLWDVVGSARREGSLDGALRDVVHNDLRRAVATLPALRAVGFNGRAAARIGRRLLGASEGLALVALPSSSAAYCRMSVAEKARAWNQLREHLG